MEKVLFFLFGIISMWLISSTFANDCVASLDITSKQGHLWVNDQVIKLKALSWFGFETSMSVFHGLWAQDYKTLLDFVKNNSFNAMRIPFHLDLLKNDIIPVGINFYDMNSDLQGLTSLQILDKVIDAAAERGIIIMLDMHSFEPDAFMANGLWYDSLHSESDVIEGWDKLIQRYAKKWNVVAFDLKNEPYLTTWNTGNNSTDWDKAATRIGNHILSNGGERFLIFVEGTGNSPACSQNCFWGEDLTGVKTSPITLSNQEKLVYSPHCYGPSVNVQPYFIDPNFPQNMPNIWDDHWGFIPNVTGQAVVIGEWGGHYIDQNKIWMDAFVQYLKSKDMTDQFFWCLNPDSGDTGGLLLYDWITPDTDKLAVLKTLVPNPTIFKTNEEGEICISN